jgi:hypothetical protein
LVAKPAQLRRKICRKSLIMNGATGNTLLTPTDLSAQLMAQDNSMLYWFNRVR